MDSCKYCDKNVYETYLLADAQYIHLTLNNVGGYVWMLAHGDNYVAYRPKFCPECGRKLKGD